MEPRVVTDTTDFQNIDRGDLIELGGRMYRVMGHAREGRFGMDDPKFWVKRVVDVETGERKYLKLSFLESFETTIGNVVIQRFRDPGKEGRILSLVADHPHFMHGTVHRDAKGNNLRLIDVVHGPSFWQYMESFEIGHEEYFHEHLPDVLRRLVRAFEAIGFLHRHGLKHGDIRNDHIIVERDTGRFVWIDFDYDYVAEENPWSIDLFGLGNTLIYAVGMGFHDVPWIRRERETYGDLGDRIEPEDVSILERWRFVNLRKLYPYVPPLLNNILMHFSRGAPVYFETVDELIEGLHVYLATV